MTKNYEDEKYNLVIAVVSRSAIDIPGFGAEKEKNKYRNHPDKSKWPRACDCAHC